MKEKALQVLVVEDNAGDVRLLREMFSKENPEAFEFTHLLRMSEAEAHLAKGGVDIVLLDMGLPDGHGIDTVRRAHAAAPQVPVIVLTGLDDEALAASAMAEGAQDYLIKGQIENRALPRALRHAIERHRMQAEADLVRTQQIELKDEFLSHVSHELRSPLTAIYQFSTILLDNLVGELNAEQQESLEIVLRNVKQLQAMISDLLEVTRVQAGKLMIEPQCATAVDAIAYAVKTFDGAATAKGVTLLVDIDAGLPSVCADPLRLRQILVILMDNAVKFTPAKGTVTVRARIFEEVPSHLLIEVIDSGCGIDPGMTEKIFDRLFQATETDSSGRKGLGLGLYICMELVRRQGGQIWAKSSPGEGSTFSVTLPIFSLSNLIDPVLQMNRTVDSPLVLVVTELGSHTGWLSEELRAEQSHEVRDVLQRCLHCDQDVLLPKMTPMGAVELFFIVANTDELGAEAITKRIRERLGKSETMRNAGLTYETSYRPLGMVPGTEREQRKMSHETVTNKILEVVNEEISLRMVQNG
jgi:signal transduction histidine kinase